MSDIHKEALQLKELERKVGLMNGLLEQVAEKIYEYGDIYHYHPEEADAYIQAKEIIARVLEHLYQDHNVLQEWKEHIASEARTLERAKTFERVLAAVEEIPVVTLTIKRHGKQRSYLPRNVVLEKIKGVGDDHAIYEARK